MTTPSPCSYRHNALDRFLLKKNYDKLVIKYGFNVNMQKEKKITVKRRIKKNEDDTFFQESVKKKQRILFFSFLEIYVFDITRILLI